MSRVVETLFLAGHETTANALTWTLYLISQNHQVEAKIIEEIKQVLENKRRPTVEDIPKFQYLRNVFTESLRLYPPAWAIGREATESILPPGARLATRWSTFPAMHPSVVGTRKEMDTGERSGNRTVLRSHAREGARDAWCDRASGAVVPQSLAAIVREDDVGVLPAERALVVDRERRPAPVVGTHTAPLQGPGGGGQMAGARSLGHVPDSTPAGTGFGPAKRYAVGSG